LKAARLAEVTRFRSAYDGRCYGDVSEPKRGIKRNERSLCKATKPYTEAGTQVYLP
jgi:hypothetical protein